MKRLLMVILIGWLSWSSLSAIPYSEARLQSRFLTDKMAYELNLNQAQYNHVYEINLDYFLKVNRPGDVSGRALRYRNQDMRYVLYDWQYAEYRRKRYMTHPMEWQRNRWFYPIYNRYHRNHFYYPCPPIYWSYRGGHCWHYNKGTSYYEHRRPSWNGGLWSRERKVNTSPLPHRTDRKPIHGRPSLERRSPERKEIFTPQKDTKDIRRKIRELKRKEYKESSTRRFH